MYDRPFPYKAQSAAWQFALHYLECFDRDGRFELAVPGMKVWRRVIVKEHPNQDPVKSADGGHWPPASLPRTKITPDESACDRDPKYAWETTKPLRESTRSRQNPAQRHP